MEFICLGEGYQCSLLEGAVSSSMLITTVPCTHLFPGSDSMNGRKTSWRGGRRGDEANFSHILWGLSDSRLHTLPHVSFFPHTQAQCLSDTVTSCWTIWRYTSKGWRITRVKSSCWLRSREFRQLAGLYCSSRMGGETDRISVNRRSLQSWCVTL